MKWLFDAIDAHVARGGAVTLFGQDLSGRRCRTPCPARPCELPWSANPWDAPCVARDVYALMRSWEPESAPTVAQLCWEAERRIRTPCTFGLQKWCY